MPTITAIRRIVHDVATFEAPPAPPPYTRAELIAAMECRLYSACARLRSDLADEARPLVEEAYDMVMRLAEMGR
jgi:hypothetical protein